MISHILDTLQATMTKRKLSVHQAIKVQMQIRRRSASRKTYVDTSGCWEIESESSIGVLGSSSEAESLNDGSYYEGDLLD
ncbi:hypothetical protein CR513_01874, partial [Mucuna pruriens]